MVQPETLNPDSTSSSVQRLLVSGLLESVVGAACHSSSCGEGPGGGGGGQGRV